MLDFETANVPEAENITQTTIEDGDIEVLQLRPNFYMIAGAGGNIAVQVGDDGIVVVDSGSAASADAVLAQIKKITSAPITARE